MPTYRGSPVASCSLPRHADGLLVLELHRKASIGICLSPA